MGKFRILSLLLALLILLSACQNEGVENGVHQQSPTPPAELGDDDASFGDSLDDLQAYAGYFEEDTVDVSVTCVSGTDGCYSLEGDTLTFTAVAEDSVYAVSGKLKGNIVIDIGDAHRFDLELKGLSLVSGSVNPITVLSGDEVCLTAKSGSVNYLYDIREAVDPDDESVYAGSVYSFVDLEVCGKGSLTLVSQNNNGIHSKKDLQVKNLSLLVSCVDNALKGNDSVQITDGSTTLIATQGDVIKTSDTDISEKGNQRGSVTVNGGTHSLYAACDGIDAAYDVVIEGADTVLDIYTDRYSAHSSEVTAVDEELYYIRFSRDDLKYSVKYSNAEGDVVWVDAEYHSTVSGGRSNYYYYAFPKSTDHSMMQFFLYSSDMETGQDGTYLACSEDMTLNTSYDTFALIERGNSLSYSWTNYSTTVQENGMGGPGGPGGMGGMDGGNTDKGEYSTKGMKAGNQIVIEDGTVTIRSYDDAIHANADASLENGDTPTGSVTVNGGVVTVFSNDDGLHADGILKITGGTVYVTNSYEGLEAAQIQISGGDVSVIASDDGINGTATSDTAVAISGGRVYVYCRGDGIDSNSRSAYQGIVFSGGETVIISDSSGNSAIDTEQGYSYTGGAILAVMPARGMTNEVTHCAELDDIATMQNVSLSSGSYLTVAVDGTVAVTVSIPTDISASVLYLGSDSASISSVDGPSVTLDSNGVSWGG